MGWGRGFLEEVGLEAAALVSANRIAKSLLPSLPSSPWQPCSPVSWEAPGLAVRTIGEGEGVQSSLSFPI